MLCGRHARAFDGRRAGRNDDLNFRVCRKHVFRRAVCIKGAESEPASILRLLDKLFERLVGGNLFRRGKTQARAARGVLKTNACENAGGINTLIEFKEHQRITRLAFASRISAFERRRRRGEVESFSFGQNIAERGFCSGGDRDGVAGRHRQPAAFRFGLKDECLCA